MQVQYVDRWDISPQVLLPTKGFMGTCIGSRVDEGRFAAFGFPAGLPGRLVQGRFAIAFVRRPMGHLTFSAAVLSRIISHKRSSETLVSPHPDKKTSVAGRCGNFPARVLHARDILAGIAA